MKTNHTIKEFGGFLSNLRQDHIPHGTFKSGELLNKVVRHKFTWTDPSHCQSQSSWCYLEFSGQWICFASEQSQDDRGSTARVSTLSETPEVASFLDAFRAKLLVWLLSVPCTWWESSSFSWSKNRTLFFVILLSDDDDRVFRALLFPFGDSWLDEKSRIAAWKKINLVLVLRQNYQHILSVSPDKVR